jgi:hypothetical protein
VELQPTKVQAVIVEYDPASRRGVDDGGADQTAVDS